MGGPDPVLVEVKAAAGLDRRGRRQRDDIATLHAFFETDAAQGLRGFADIRRVAYGIPERTHEVALNACIAQARRGGAALCRPEYGVTYAVMTARAPSLDELLKPTDMAGRWVVSLNEYKVYRAWSPYVPFTLTIRGHDDLSDFIRGDLYILVLVDPDAFCRAARESGCSATWDETDSDYPLHILLPGFDEPGKASRGVLMRTMLEFVSPQWLVTSTIEVMRSALAADAAAARTLATMQ